MMGYYRDPRTFPLIGYRGPFVARRAEEQPGDRSRARSDGRRSRTTLTPSWWAPVREEAWPSRELARAGLKVIAVEEGGAHTAADFSQREDGDDPAALSG